MGFGRSEFQCATCRHCGRLDRDGVICRFGHRETFKGPAHISMCMDHEADPSASRGLRLLPGRKEKGPAPARRAPRPGVSERFGSWMPVLVPIGILALVVFVVRLAGRGEGSAAFDSPLHEIPVQAGVEGWSPELGLADGILARAWKETVVLESERIGEVSLPSGRLVACDPLHPVPLPYEVPLPRGRHPVHVTLARFPKGESRVAFARVRFTEGKPVRWRVAGFRDQSWEFPSESGLAAFLDFSTVQLLGDEGRAPRGFPGALRSALGKNQRKEWSWAELGIDSDQDANVVAFSAGTGDGAYGTAFGFDEDGNVVTVVVDFGIVGEGPAPRD